MVETQKWRFQKILSKPTLIVRIEFKKNVNFVINGQKEAYHLNWPVRENSKQKIIGWSTKIEKRFTQN